MSALGRRTTERDEALSEIEALKAQLDEQWAGERDAYEQRGEPGGVVPEALADEGQGGLDADADVGSGEDREPEPIGLEFPDDEFVPGAPAAHAAGQPVIAGTNPGRMKPIPFGSESSIEQTRAMFARMAEAEDARIREELARRWTESPRRPSRQTGCVPIKRRSGHKEIDMAVGSASLC